MLPDKAGPKPHKRGGLLGALDWYLAWAIPGLVSAVFRCCSNQCSHPSLVKSSGALGTRQGWQISQAG
jgi:hypothetical protein